jgi:RNA 2',3'-cyclic 3'-phosphodiesterase
MDIPPALTYRRCFVALMVPPEAWPALNAARAQWQWPAAQQPLQGADLHMTLHFIGDLASQRADALQQALAAIPMRPLPVAVDLPQLWSGETAVITGVASAAMSALHADVGRALVDFGLAVDARQWRPHVSLARKSKGAVAPATPTPVAWQATALALACAASGGAQRYHLLGSWPAEAA